MKKPIVIHPILFAVFPVWFLYSRNTDQVSIGEIFLPTIVFMVLALIVWVVFGLLLRNGIKAGLVTSFLMLLNFSYGRIHDLLVGVGLWGLDIARHRYLVTVSALVFLIMLLLIWKTKKKLWKLTGIINAISVFLIVVPTITVIYSLAFHSGEQKRVEAEGIHLERPLHPPDIYYIILDGYGRADVLSELYDYDNSEFLDHLSKTGFFVVKEGRSNYAQTYLSLASSLNFTYLDDLAGRPISQSAKAGILIDMIKNSRIAEVLKHSGYSTVAFASGYSGTELRNADFFVSPRWTLSEFQAILVGGTLISVLVEKLSARTSVAYSLHRKRILFTLDKLPEMAETESPVFVFAHVLAPHPPFVFGADGQTVNQDRSFSLVDGSHFMSHGSKDEYVKGYREQLSYVNTLLVGMIDRILSRSTRPPVIILQGDHGPGSRLDWNNAENTDFTERMGILNAIYLPDSDSSGLYDRMTPVNTFRIVLDDIFGAGLPILEDRCYFSTIGRPYEFMDVTAMTDTEAELPHTRPGK
jgi:hypothetical protein